MKKNKTISIEAVVLSDEKPTGVSRAVKGYVTSLTESDRENIYHVFLVSPAGSLSLNGTNVVMHYFSDLLPSWLRTKRCLNFLYKVKFIYIWFIIPFILKKIRSDVFIGTHGLLFPQYISKSIKTFYIVYDFVWKFYPETMSRKNKFLMEYISRRNICMADEIITISDSVSSELKEYIDRDKICHTVHLGFDQTVFFPVKNNVQTIKRTLEKFNITRPYILSVATIEPRKNLEAVCRTFEQFNTEHKYQLVIAGKIGWKTSPILDIIRNSSAADDIIITGFVDDRDLSPLFSAADLFIFLSLYEGFGLPVLEAMACGCPVLTSNIAPLFEITGTSAVIVNPANPDDVVSSLKKITGDPAFRNKMSKKSLDRSKEFTWDRSGQVLKKIILKD